MFIADNMGPADEEIALCDKKKNPLRIRIYEKVK